MREPDLVERLAQSRGLEAVRRAMLRFDPKRKPNEEILWLGYGTA